MFENAKKFNQDLSKWSTRFAKDMASMFKNALAFNANISGWDVTSITTLSETFLNATAFTQNLSPWDVRKYVCCCCVVLSFFFPPPDLDALSTSVFSHAMLIFKYYFFFSPLPPCIGRTFKLRFFHVQC